ncbi:MAG: glycine--tRNA ligase [Thermoplasmataceae archaeon]
MSKFEEVAEISKRRGFFWPSFQIYGGSSGLYDYGPLGTILKENVYSIWAEEYLKIGAIMFDSPSVTPEPVFKASGHIQRFADIATMCEQCKSSYKVESLLSEKGINHVPDSEEDASRILVENKIRCKKCGSLLSRGYRFNLMFQVSGNQNENLYLRPETAQGIFVNFKLLLTYNRGKLPMIVIQRGKGFRNEISPRQAIIRQREFNMAEVEVFLDPNEKSDFVVDTPQEITLMKADGSIIKETLPMAHKNDIIHTPEHAYFMGVTLKIALRLGINIENLRFRQHRKDELAHYSSDCWDLEFLMDDDWIEIVGVSDRGQFDVTNHQSLSGQNLSFGEGEMKITRVLEPAYGIDRVIMSLLVSSYNKRESGYKVLSFPPEVAPYSVAVLPLQKKDGLAEKALDLFNKLRIHEPFALFDDSGSIGRRYSRQDEIGTPYCITVDYDTMTDNVVTIRDRDSQKQISKIPIDTLTAPGRFIRNPILKRFEEINSS